MSDIVLKKGVTLDVVKECIEEIQELSEGMSYIYANILKFGIHNFNAEIYQNYPYTIYYKDKIVGIVGYEIINYNVYFLSWLLIKKEYRKKGIAKEAINMLENILISKFPDIKYVYCVATTEYYEGNGEWNNEPPYYDIVNFYKKIGYNELCVVKDITQEQLDEMGLTKEEFSSIISVEGYLGIVVRKDLKNSQDKCFEIFFKPLNLDDCFYPFIKELYGVSEGSSYIFNDILKATNTIDKDLPDDVIIDGFGVYNGYGNCIGFALFERDPISPKYISISWIVLGDEYRGKGYGSKILSLLLNIIKEKYPETEYFISNVQKSKYDAFDEDEWVELKDDENPSIKMFRRQGFELVTDDSDICEGDICNITNLADYEETYINTEHYMMYKKA